MNKRLVWNFEINPKPPLELPKLTAPQLSEWKFELRYFWREDKPICLHGLDDSFLNLHQYKIKERSDRYFLLPGVDKNIKERKGELLYKPLMQPPETLGASLAFGKKIRLNSHTLDILPGTSQMSTADLLRQIHLDAQATTVTKVALLYTLPLEPSIKLELARLCLNEKTYFSASVEGYCSVWVNAIGQQLFEKNKDVIAYDYVSFLKTILRIP